MSENIWNPIIETLPLELLAKYQFKLFIKLLKHACENVPFYKERYKEAGITYKDINNIEHISNLPIITKEDFLSSQTGTDPFPYGNLLGVPVEDVIRFHQTTGTTGIPLRVADMPSDWEAYSESWAMLLYSSGLRASDRVYIPSPYHFFIAFWGGHYGVEKLGAEVIPGGQASSQQRIQEMKDLKCTAMMCTPTYALRLAEIAKNQGIDSRKDIPIKRIFCLGEPGASIPATKARIEAEWNAKVYNVCGSTEAPLWAFECEAQKDLHLNESSFFVEILNPYTYEPAGPGEPGTVVITNLKRYAMPFIRVNLRDVAKISSKADPCSCGRTWRQIDGGIIGRMDNLIKVRGVLILPSIFEQAVRKIPQLGDEFQIVVKNENDYDRIIVTAEVLPEYQNNKKDIAKQVLRELRQVVQLRCELELCDLGTLTRNKGKSSRFRDLRNNL